MVIKILLGFGVVFYLVLAVMIAASLRETQDLPPFVAMIIGFLWGPVALLGVGVRLYDRYVKGEKFPSV